MLPGRSIRRVRQIAGHGLWHVFVKDPALLPLAFIALAPVLAIQLGAPTFMRGRTSPLPGGALVGALLVVLVTNCLFPVLHALTFQRMTGHAFPFTFRNLGILAATALAFGVRVTVGLLAGILPGFVLQGRYAIAPIIAITERARGRQALERSTQLTRGVQHTLLPLVVLAPVVSLLGQSVFSVLAENLGAVQPVSPGGTTESGFTLSWPAYALVTLLAYVWNATVLAVQATSFTLVYFALEEVPTERTVASGAKGVGHGAAANLTRWVWITTAAPAVIVGVGALTIKMVQHVR